MIGLMLYVVTFLSAGCYLLTHGHPFAGGICIFMAASVSYKEEKKPKG